MRKLPEHVAIQIAGELAPLTGAERSIRAKELAERYAVSTKTINAAARKNGVRARSARADSGQSSCPDELIKLVASGLLVGKNLKGQYTNPVRNVMKMLEAGGTMFPVSYARMCQLLKERGYCKDALAMRKPHHNLLSKYPNEVWQFDVSNCLQWHLKKGTGLTDVWDFELKFYKNKAADYFKANPRQLRRYVIIDHCSGAFYFQYFYAPGERAEDGALFFYNAFADKEFLLADSLGVLDSKYRFCGVPEILVSDKGSILRNGALVNLMSNLGVKIELHQAGAPWEKGAVEGAMNIIGTHFEPLLKYKRPESLEELNLWALAWCMEFNFEQGFRGSADSRHALWERGIKGHLRNCPNFQVFSSLQHLKEEERKVGGDGLISYDGKKYYVPNADAPRRSVSVCANAYEWPAVTIKCAWDATVYVVKPVGYDEYHRPLAPSSVEYGSYKTFKKTRSEKAREELEQVATEAFGTGWKGNAAKRQAVAPENAPLPAMLGNAIDDAVNDDIPRLPIAGVDIVTPNLHEPVQAEPKLMPLTVKHTPTEADRFVPVDEMIRDFVKKFGRITPEQKSIILKMYPKGVPIGVTQAEIRDLIDNNTGGINNAKQA